MPDSRAQVRAAHAVMEGHSDIMPRDVADEIVSKMRGRKMKSLPERARKGKRFSFRKRPNGNSHTAH